MATHDDNLDSYPAALRDAIRKQRDELKARQLAGQQTVGPWAPAAELKKKRRRRQPANVQPMRRTGT